MKIMRMAAAALVSAAVLFTSVPAYAEIQTGSVVQEALASKTSLSSCTVSSISARVYTGSAIKPAVLIKFRNKTLRQGVDYKLSYSNNKNVGKGIVTITGKGNYSGTRKIAFRIIPQTPTLTADSVSGGASLSWTTAAGAQSYMVYMADSGGKFKKVDTLTATDKTVKLEPGTYQFKVRAIAKVKGVTYYGKFSEIKTVTVAGSSSGSGSGSAAKTTLKTADFSFWIYENGVYEEKKLSDYAGKPIVVNIWATWCGPCISELPGFNNMYKKYGDKVQFLMLNCDMKVGNVKDYLSAKGYSFAPCSDLTGFDTYGTGYIPLTLMINADGELVYNEVGSMSESALESRVKDLL